ncbi:MAG: hypothetical protein HY398_01085 [Candidatus Doudnabacteria bacterium]|nr:hypothetical protein [Candidatus Doudnabacteria bacterium]
MAQNDPVRELLQQQQAGFIEMFRHSIGGIKVAALILKKVKAVLGTPDKPLPKSRETDEATRALKEIWNIATELVPSNETWSLD